MNTSIPSEEREPRERSNDSPDSRDPYTDQPVGITLIENASMISKSVIN